jgi:two-component system response regulator HydG
VLYGVKRSGGKSLSYFGLRGQWRENGDVHVGLTMVFFPDPGNSHHSGRAMIGKLLVIDDDAASRRLIEAIFARQGVEIVAVQDGKSGLEAAAIHQPDVVLLDVRMPGLDGLQVLEKLRAANPSLPVVMLTGSRDLKTAIHATRLGAFDYLTKPVDDEEVAITVQRALEMRTLRLEVQELRRQAGNSKTHTLSAQMGRSAHVKHIVERVEAVAGSNFTVLVLGETGTGKELVAQAIHQLSDRHRRPFVALDCGAIPEPLLETELFGHERGAFTGAERRKEGRFRVADGGTCFLDEVGNLSLALQAKLLRVLESREVQPIGAERAMPLDVRFVAATNDDLQERATQGRFRSDLYFRLAQYTIRLPPLRERAEDIPYLTQRFLEEASIELRRPVQAIVADALDLFRRYSWPGNVRELRNVVRQAVLETQDLAIRPEAVRAVLGRSEPAARVAAAARPSGQSLREIASQAAAAAERQAITETLRATSGNKSRAAKELKTDFKTLHVKMKQLGIRGRDFGE